MSQIIEKQTPVTPRGACDCHVHIYGAPDVYPSAPTSPFLPPLAATHDYRQVMNILGTQRVVLVQPAAYGTDNRCMTDALSEFGDCARGIATVTPATNTAELKRLHALGVRGARALMLPGAVLRMSDLPALAIRIRPYDWHIQLQIDGRVLPQHEAMLAALPVPLVIDHNGKFLEPVPMEHPGMQTLLRLLDSGRCWIKASAPYETSRTGAPHYDDVGKIATALIEQYPDRVVWATNWPHGSVRGTKPLDIDLLNLLTEWAPDPIVRKRILVNNPATLYGFDPLPVTQTS